MAPALLAAVRAFSATVEAIVERVERLDVASCRAVLAVTCFWASWTLLSDRASAMLLTVIATLLASGAVKPMMLSRPTTLFAAWAVLTAANPATR